MPQIASFSKRITSSGIGEGRVSQVAALWGLQKGFGYGMKRKKMAKRGV